MIAHNYHESVAFNSRAKFDEWFSEIQLIQRGEATLMSIDDFNIPLSSLRNSMAHKRLVVGVAVFASFPSAPRGIKKLLLLQRAASEDAFPSMYELPGGCAESGDNTILATVSRELLEETGLVVRDFITAFEGFEYQTRKGWTIQFNFVVEVEGDGGDLFVTLNKEEHDHFAWITNEEDLSNFPMTEEMRIVVDNAFNVMPSVSE